MIHLQSIQVRPLLDKRGFPFSLLLLHSLKELRFVTPDTLLVGENGTGKSTILEALACTADMVVVGSESTRATKVSPTHVNWQNISSFPGQNALAGVFSYARRIFLALPNALTRCARKWNLI